MTWLANWLNLIMPTGKRPIASTYRITKVRGDRPMKGRGRINGILGFQRRPYVKPPTWKPFNP